MPRILLVDDEPLATGTLQTLILDAMDDVEVISVNSSVRAAELLEKNVYDVVVTDVSMPRISGLELLERIRSQGILCYVIVLTAYDDFTYAYRAAQYDDVRFILKVEPHEVILDAVRTGLKRIRQYYSFSQDNQRLRQFRQESLPLLRQTLLERLLVYGEALPDQVASGGCGIRILPHRDTWLAATGSIMPQEKQQEVCFMVLSMLGDHGIRADVWYAEQNLLFLMQPEEAGMDIPQKIQGQLDRMIEGAGSTVGLSFVLTEGPVSWARIGSDAAALMNYARNTLEHNRIVRLCTDAEPRGGTGFRELVRWHRLMEKRSTEELAESIRSCILREGYPQGRGSYGMLILLLLRDLFDESTLEGTRVQGYSVESVLLHKNFATLDEWLDAVQAMLAALFSGRTSRCLNETGALLNRVNEYIQEHYMEPISLTMIAEQFSYNSSYLSRTYKQNMHEGISEHIIRTRIEAACRLLSAGGDSISSIAEQCGFQTTKYFITAFRRMMGTTPKAWRETHTNS